MISLLFTGASGPVYHQPQKVLLRRRRDEKCTYFYIVPRHRSSSPSAFITHSDGGAGVANGFDSSRYSLRLSNLRGNCEGSLTPFNHPLCLPPIECGKIIAYNEKSQNWEAENIWAFTKKLFRSPSDVENPKVDGKLFRLPSKTVFHPFDCFERASIALRRKNIRQSVTCAAVCSCSAMFYARRRSIKHSECTFLDALCLFSAMTSSGRKFSPKTSAEETIWVPWRSEENENEAPDITRDSGKCFSFKFLRCWLKLYFTKHSPSLFVKIFYWQVISRAIFSDFSLNGLTPTGKHSGNHKYCSGRRWGGKTN